MRRELLGTSRCAEPVLDGFQRQKKRAFHHLGQRNLISGAETVDMVDSLRSGHRTVVALGVAGRGCRSRVDWLVDVHILLIGLARLLAGLDLPIALVA